MFIRRVLIRLLLLALCFHTVIGMPAHEATHLAQKIERTAATSAALSGETESGEPGTSSIDSLCAWCLAFAHLSTAVGTAPIRPLAAVASAGLPDPALVIGFVPRLERWRYAARDPPPAPVRG